MQQQFSGGHALRLAGLRALGGAEDARKGKAVDRVQLSQRHRLGDAAVQHQHLLVHQSRLRNNKKEGKRGQREEEEEEDDEEEDEEEERRENSKKR